MLIRRTSFLFLIALGGLLLLPQSTSAAPVRVPGDVEGEDFLLERNDYFLSRRLSGDNPLGLSEASDHLFNAANDAQQLQAQSKTRLPNAFGGAWSAIGPNPIVQVSAPGHFVAVSGRIGALAIRSDGRRILGAAQGGIWVWNKVTSTWEPKSDFQRSLAIGALAVAPSNEDIVYAGSGEAALSGDSYAGNGVLKSTDGGMTWAHVSGNSFRGVAVSRIVVDPSKANHLWLTITRGRGGNRRTTKPPNTPFGVYESWDGGAHWTLLKAVPATSLGATDLEVDPRNTQILYTTFWGDAIYKSTNGGASWNKIMNGLPSDANYPFLPTRFSIAITHPRAQPVTLYLGFAYEDNTNHFHKSRVWKSTDEGASWFILPAGSGANSVADYCGGQCFYDNVIEVDPANANYVYAGGQFNYAIGSGGIFRSDDGGATWKNLGYDQHPDFHALAFKPNDTAKILSGSDGGVWYSANRGGRPGSDPLSAVDWVNLNGTVDPSTAAVTARTDLQITQFTSIANVPTLPARFWGGTQDNGTPRKSTLSASWFDIPSGDGGQALVDPTSDTYVYGTYFGITPYRFAGGGLNFFSNESITNGIDLSDRAEFYVPFAMNRSNPDQLYLGTFRLYRTDNAKAASAGDVLWHIISPDLTSGCTGPAPNGGRGCFISAIGVSRGNGGVWIGTEEGRVQYSPNASASLSPNWNLVGTGVLPNRPVQSIAVDNSDYRIAYVGFGSFNQATPTIEGHIFKTSDAGATWTNISGNLPNSPVNSVILDPSFPDTLYIGTDVGPFVTNNGGASWSRLGTDIPIVAIWQLDLDPANRNLAAGTHGRGAWVLNDSATKIPALVLSKTRPDIPVGPGSQATFTLTVTNIGNARATGVRISDFIPDQTSFVSASLGGTLAGDHVIWSGLAVPAGGSVSVQVTIKIANNATDRIRNDRYLVTSHQGVGTTGSPLNVKFAPRYGVAVSPASQLDGTRVGQSLNYHVNVMNKGFKSDKYKMDASDNTFPTSLFDSACTTPLLQTGTLSPGDSVNVCVQVSVPGGASNGTKDTGHINATSVADSTVNDAATIKTIAVTDDILLVDGDLGAPDVESYYKTALNAYGQSYNYWDLSVDDNLPPNYMKAHKAIVWFTGNAYPAPITPYESKLKDFLDNGGHFFLSGQDVLDQAAGTTAFVHDYLHVNWDGSETQNDISTSHVHGVGGNPITGSIGAIALDHSVLGAAFEDQITLVSPATAAFTDDKAQDDALNVTTSGYKVVFLAFPFEAYGSANDKATLMAKILNYFGP